MAPRATRSPGLQPEELRHAKIFREDFVTEGGEAPGFEGSRERRGFDFVAVGEDDVDEKGSRRRSRRRRRRGGGGGRAYGGEGGGGSERWVADGDFFETAEALEIDLGNLGCTLSARWGCERLKSCSSYRYSATMRTRVDAQSFERRAALVDHVGDISSVALVRDRLLVY